MTQPRRISQHDKITAEIRELIVSGRWLPGHQLPVETDLAQLYGVSRMTMNKALTRLAREGFLIRRKKRGTFVAQPRAQSAVMEIADIEAEVGSMGQDYRFVLLSRKVIAMSEFEAADVGCGAVRGQSALRVEGLHSADGQPFCHETRLVNPDQAPGVLEQDFSATPPGTWLLRQVPWSEASHRIRALNADADIAASLALNDGDACLEIVRRTRTAEGWVTWARLVYPGDSHQLHAAFAPRDQSDQG
ncbi:UTRA domain-containing protein [Puniceibacterium sediminis]|uniref:Transcriptional regulator, GntR family n=1 Tax=Puniceibacterium sediminis TaxID=1608407 RepID=A0A238YYL5_9RHOB|nr:UTRA domain-containing protein [Puniceibacterium sediminis]SNR75609.1 transcriptional regulator, GntR family [Puniceibacterium sediminis]